MRTVERLCDGWRFLYGECGDAEKTDFDDSLWELVRVPHDWAAKGPFGKNYDMQIVPDKDGTPAVVSYLGRSGGLPHVGKGTYRRRFSLAAGTGKAVYLEFDGVMSNSKIYVNGQYVYARPYGYSSFVCDVTRFVRFGAENLLTVTVDNPPLSSRWYPGAGIYRNVRLVVTEKSHVLPWGIHVRTQKIEEARALLSLNVETSGQPDFSYRILSPSGTEVFSGQGKDGSAEFALDNFEAWDVNDPKLYYAVVSLSSGDEVRQRFGIREVIFDSEEGMKLNGRKIRMNGVCMHHDLGPLGAAFSHPAAKRQLRILRGIGVNAIRTSHNLPDPGMLDLCDEMGFLVIDEAFDAWTIGKLANDYHIYFDEWSETDLADMVRRDRNHPCIVLWSIGNEIREQDSEDGWKIAERLRDIVRKADSSRPVTAGMNQGEKAFTSGIVQVLDVPGFNYKPHKYPEYRERLPGKPMFGSETASTVSSRGEYYFPVESGVVLHTDTLQSSSYDIEHPEWAYPPDKEFQYQDACGWIMGEFVWTGFDYLGEPCPYDSYWPSHASYFGIFDLVGLPKDRAYLYKSRWTDEPVLHLLPHWNFPNRIGLVTPVHCYTSFNDVELFLNGRSLGRKSRGSAYRIQWDDVVYEPGELKAVAYGADGKIAMEAFRKTAGEPALLKLESDEKCPLAADGEDMAFVTVTVCDINGYPHPYASNSVCFEVEGPAEIVGVGNGDSTCLETFGQNRIHVFNGQAVVYLRSLKNETGTVTFKAVSGNLTPAEIKFEIQ